MLELLAMPREVNSPFGAPDACRLRAALQPALVLLLSGPRGIQGRVSGLVGWGGDCDSCEAGLLHGVAQADGRAQACVAAEWGWRAPSALSTNMLHFL